MADDIFSEIDDDLRAERLRAQSRRFAGVGLALLVLVGLVIGGWQFLAWKQQQRAVAVAGNYFAAQKDADLAPPAAAGPDAAPTAEQTHALNEFSAVAAHGPAGFAALSRLRVAALAWRANDHDRALSMWDQVSHADAADPDLRGLADLLWVQHQLDTADPSLLKLRLREILKPSSPWHALASEADALIDLRLGHLSDAKRKLAAIAADHAASEGTRARASGLLQTLDTTSSNG